MASIDDDTSAAAATTTERLRKAMEGGDLEGVLETFAPDIVLNSPITDSAAFYGLDDMRSLMTAILEIFEDVDYFEDLGDERTRYLAARARIGRQPVEESLRIRLDGQALIAEITVFIRPLPGLTAMLAALGPRLARRRGPAHAAAFTAMAKPLALITRAGDKTGTRLAGLRPKS